MTLRTYSELVTLATFRERFEYLSLKGMVGDATFGPERYVNQRFYRSTEWKQIRNHVLARDWGCDLAMQGWEVHSRPIIHHMNPMNVRDIVHANADILNPEFLITTTHRTHNAIHYGDESLLALPFEPRRPGDTTLWSRKAGSQ